MWENVLLKPLLQRMTDICIIRSVAERTHPTNDPRLFNAIKMFSMLWCKKIKHARFDCFRRSRVHSETEFGNDAAGHFWKTFYWRFREVSSNKHSSTNDRAFSDWFSRRSKCDLFKDWLTSSHCLGQWVTRERRRDFPKISPGIMCSAIEGTSGENVYWRSPRPNRWIHKDLLTRKGHSK